MLSLTDQDFDQLALQAAEILGFESGATVAYDVAGYDRCYRTPIAPQDLLQRDASQTVPLTLPTQAQFAERSYLVRLAGFRRRNVFGPDEIGELMQSHKIAWSDGLGNGLYESLLICRKYGLSYVLEAPILGFRVPFLESEWALFKREYPRIVDRLVADVRLMEAIYGDRLVGDALKLIVLWQKDYPLAHFQRAYRRDPGAVSTALRAATGLESLPVQPSTPAERAALMRFWNWIQRQQVRLAEYQAEVLRAALGPQTLVIANPHELPVLDFAGQGRAFDCPSVAIRPLLLDDEVMLRHYIAYYSQLYHDLTGKPPMVSVRMNLSAATPQFVPTGRLIRAWYDQAVRHGACGFYFWTRDYPPSDDPATYDGPIPGNPVASTLPVERWEASLDILGRLATHRRFIQPQADVAILVPIEAALLHREEWRRIYAVFSALAEARIFACFVSDQQVAKGELPVGVKAVLAPHLEFITPELRGALDEFTQQGGLLLAAAGQVYTPKGAPAEPLAGATRIDGALFEAFPLGKPGRLEDLQRLSVVLQEYLDAARVDPLAWVFDVGCANLPPAEQDWLRDSGPQVYFAPWMHEPGLIGAALTDPRVTCGLILDGNHLHSAVVQIIYRTAGVERINLVTDAIAALGMPPGRYTIGTQKIVVDKSSARLENGVLAGSILSMDTALRNFRQITGCVLAQALQTVTTTPARLLGEHQARGRIAPGLRADLVLLTSEIEVAATIIGGDVAYSNQELVSL